MRDTIHDVLIQGQPPSMIEQWSLGTGTRCLSLKTEGARWDGDAVNRATGCEKSAARQDII